MATDKLLVKAGKNGRVFMEGKPVVIGPDGMNSNAIGAEPVEVPNSRYYRRRLAAGDLVEVTPEVDAKVTAPSPGAPPAGPPPPVPPLARQGS